MDERKQREILAKIAEARRKRIPSGVNAKQIRNITRPPSTPIANPHKKGEPVKRLQRNRKARLNPQIGEKAPENRLSFFFSGSIGDVLALESFFTDEERMNVDGFCYASQKNGELTQLFQALPNYRDLKFQNPVWTDFSRFWCFFTKAECVDRIRVSGVVPAPDLLRSHDWSINVKFPQIRNGQIKYNHSSFLMYNLADISRFSLPENYFVICPCSTDKRLVGRDFTEEDWTACLETLRLAGIPGVVLNTGPDKIPSDPSLINLNNMTTICEAVEILKHAVGYIGIDSSLSVLAAKLFNYPALQVKSRNDHCHQNKECYFAPQSNFNFLVRSIHVPGNLAKITSSRKSIIKGKPITIKCKSGLKDLCWLMPKLSRLKESHSIPWIKLKLQLPGDHNDNITTEFAKRFKFVDEVVAERFEIYDSCTSKCQRLNYIEDGYHHVANEFVMMPSRHVEWDGRLESYMPDVPCDWQVLNGTSYERDPEGTKYAMSLVQESSLRGNPRSGYITVHLGSKPCNTVGGMNRGGNWTVQHWRQLLHSLEAVTTMPVYLLGGPEDKDYARELMEFPSPTVRRLTDLTGQTNMTVTVEILRHASLHLSYPSGLGVAATYMHTPTIMFWREPGSGLLSWPIYYFSKNFSTNWVPRSSINSSYFAPSYGADSVETVFNMASKIIGDGKWTV